MKLKFENIGRISSAEIEINTISLIAGINNSGKSTVGKLLFSISNGLYQLNRRNLLKYKMESILDSLNQIRRFSRRKEFEGLTSEVRTYLKSLSQIEEESFSELERLFSTRIIDLLEDINKSILDDEPSSSRVKVQMTIDEIESKLKIPFDSETIKYSILNKTLNHEFSHSITSKFEDVTKSEIYLYEDNEDSIKLSYDSFGNLDETQSNIDLSRDYHRAIYIDDPYVIDETDMFFYLADSDSHKGLLRKMLSENEIEPNYFEINYQQNTINKIFNDVLDGSITKTSNNMTYKNRFLTDEISASNLSTGMKSFLILKVLIESGELNDSEYLILDEPEVHLHPQWQIEYARLVVLISKNFPVRILITSHSPYFIEALDIFSKEYKQDGVKYYNAVSTPNINGVFLEEVTNNLEEIFEDMYQPFNYLEEKRDSIDE